MLLSRSFSPGGLISRPSVFYVNRVSWDSKGHCASDLLYLLTHILKYTHTQTHQTSCHCFSSYWICPVKAWRTNPHWHPLHCKQQTPPHAVSTGFSLERECNFRVSYIYPSTVRLEGLRCTTACHECLRGQTHFMNALEFSEYRFSWMWNADWIAVIVFAEWTLIQLTHIVRYKLHCAQNSFFLYYHFSMLSSGLG